ncbi:MAG: hypothetical protein HY401_09675 [Elusimicrobia bacterium]|nr:hypothetical protein [Elusimicrobiota bacterium]
MKTKIVAEKSVDKSAGDIIIFVENGAVVDVISNREGMQAMVVDHDIEGSGLRHSRYFQLVSYDPESVTDAIAGQD